MLERRGLIERDIENAWLATGPEPGLLLTTEVMVAEAPKKDSDHPPMPGGGMGGMDM